MTDITSNSYAMARDYATRGWAVIPLHWGVDGGCSCADGPNPCGGDSAAKHPLKKRWSSGGRLSVADVHSIWVEETPHANVGIRTGVISGFFVLDVDPKAGGFQSLQKLQADIGVLPETYVVKTPSGGYHFYFTVPDFPIRNSANRELLRRYGPGLDIRGDGGQVVAPPSVTPHGTYVVQVNAPIAAAPAALLDLLRAQGDVAGPDATPIEDLPAAADLSASEAQRAQKYAQSTIEIVTAEYRDAVPGTGNDTLFKSACSAIEIAQAPWNTFTVAQVYQTLHDAARARRATHPHGGGQSDAEFEQVWRSARNRTVGQGRALPVNPSEALAFDPFVNTGIADPFAAPKPIVETPAPDIFAPPIPPAPAATESVSAPEAERAIAPPVTVVEPPVVELTEAGVEVLATLPVEFYEQRVWLKDLRRIAHERMAAADAVLGSYLAIVASQIPPGLRLDTSIGSPLTASLYVIMVGPSGRGKTKGTSVAKKLYREHIVSEVLATGEGLVEAFWGKTKIQDPNTLKFTTERAQVHTNKLFVLDEGQGLLQMEKRVGNMTGVILRSAWSGSDAGQSNATEERKRKLEAGTYNLGLVMGMQNEVAGELLADPSLGTPQRFLWFSVIDPTMKLTDVDRPFDDVLTHPIHPSHIRLAPPSFIGGSTTLDLTPMPMTLDASIRRRLREEDYLKSTGQIAVDEQDSQKPASLGKLAMIFAYLDGHDHVNEDHWNMATTVYDTSALVREQLLEMEHRRQRDGKLAIAQDKAREKQAIGRYGHEQVETMQKIYDWIANGKNTRRAITQNAKGARREVLADVLDQMVKAGYLKEIDAGNRQIRYERVEGKGP